MSLKRIELRDNNQVLRAYIDNIVTSCSWEWTRIGGCGGARLTLRTDFDSTLAGLLREDYQIRIYLPGASGVDLWYTGYIDKVLPNVTGKGEQIEVNVLGYINQLKRVIIREKTYDGEISIIAKDVINTWVTAITNILYDATLYTETNFTADSLYFDESAYDIINKLAEIAGKIEWGVGSDLKFFFYQRDDTIKRYYHIKEDFIEFKPAKDYNPMITKIYLVGSEGYNQIFTVTNKITTREMIVTNSAITTQSVGQQFARMFLKENGITKKSFVGKTGKGTSRIESSLPLGKAAVNIKIGVNEQYDTSGFKYDASHKYDSGTESYQIEKISYQLTDTGIIPTIYFGPLPGGIVDDLGRLNYLIDNERIRI